MEIKLQFGTYKGTTILKHLYGNQRIALEIIMDTGEPLMIATVNLPHVPLKENEIIIKDWSENEGVLESLIKGNVVEDTGRTIRTGFVMANVCRLLPEENWTKTKVIKIQFEGIDSWNRPIFKDMESKSRYGSVDILFDYDSKEGEVLERISEKDLLWFGNSFGCEPMGDVVENLKIVKGV